jgi:hypothetical protein
LINYGNSSRNTQPAFSATFSDATTLLLHLRHRNHNSLPFLLTPHLHLPSPRPNTLHRNLAASFVPLPRPLPVLPLEPWLFRVSKA